jgi:hypothetical protein
MGIFGEIRRAINGWLMNGVEQAEDPESILTESQESWQREFGNAEERGPTPNLPIPHTPDESLPRAATAPEPAPGVQPIPSDEPLDMREP